MRFILTSLLAAVAVASPIVETITPRQNRPTDVNITSVSISGTGCPAGTVKWELGEDKTVLAITYDSFQAVSGPGINPANWRKFCNVRIGMNTPPGWSYTLATTTMRGYVNVPDISTCSAQLNATYFYSGQEAQITPVSFTFPSGTEEDFTRSSTIGQFLWSSCSANGQQGPLFNVKSVAKVDCRNDFAVLGVDTQETKLVMQMALQWRQCQN